jgi:pantoate--beta-alanine ligase
VTTVVFRLFQIAKAHKAYFGQKDFQQCVIIKKMIHDLEIPIEIEIMPIIRNAEGLALSSRNQYLSESEREKALHLPMTLLKIEEILIAKNDPKALINSELKNSEWDYLEILDTKDLCPVANLLTKTEVVIIGAYRLGNTRLLDNRVVKINA